MRNSNSEGHQIGVRGCGTQGGCYVGQRVKSSHGANRGSAASMVAPGKCHAHFNAVSRVGQGYYDLAPPSVSEKYALTSRVPTKSSSELNARTSG